MTTLLVSSKGQIVLPADIRRRLGLGPGTKLELVEEQGGLKLRVLKANPSTDLTALAGMIKAPVTGKARRLQDFDPATLLAREPKSS